MIRNLYPCFTEQYHFFYWILGENLMLLSWLKILVSLGETDYDGRLLLIWRVRAASAVRKHEIPFQWLSRPDGLTSCKEL
ncbi:MAG: hypothetical protein CSA34_05235 [Desulfobulbus propionicus]|nr:MAG: hypothetical protein CSA34_05235 [Desulfobulbus propionicus]